MTQEQTTEMTAPMNQEPERPATMTTEVGTQEDSMKKKITKSKITIREQPQPRTRVSRHTSGKYILCTNDILLQKRLEDMGHGFSERYVLGEDVIRDIRRDLQNAQG